MPGRRLRLSSGMAMSSGFPTAGDRHVVVSAREATGLPGVERCVFEERPGTGSTTDGLNFDVYLSLDDENDAPL
jgi:hypothetical protein